MALRPNNNFRNNRREEEPYRINNLIKGVAEVRLVGENVEVGIMDFKKALDIAVEQGLYLVEISPKAVPPVCRVTDYEILKYEQNKK
jgi:translation initiation factor IF-3